MNDWEGSFIVCFKVPDFPGGSEENHENTDGTVFVT